MVEVVRGMGVDLACERRGQGPPILLVHGRAERGASWAGLAAGLGEHVRVITYDRRGYGASGAPEPYERTTVAEQAEDAAALLEALGVARAVVCGRDLGALVALDLAKRHRALVAGAAVIDPPLFAFSAAATEVLGAERVALEEALRDAGPAGAVAAWLRARGAAPERLKWADEDHGAFFADFAGLATWPVSRRELRAWDVPLVVVVSDGAPGPVREGAAALASLVPGAEAVGEADLARVLRELAAAAGGI